VQAWRLLAGLLAANAAWPLLADAVPPALCRQRQLMIGALRGNDGRGMPVAVSFHVRSDENDLSLDGKFRCTAKRDRATRCLLERGRISVYGFFAGGGAR